MSPTSAQLEQRSPTAGTKRSPESLSSGRQEPEDAWSSYDLDNDGGRADGSRKRKKNSRPLSVSCETCKQRKVKCDRGQPNCGWCTRNNQLCEYKERKKPGLRAGYGRELEAKLGEQAVLIDQIRAMLKRHDSAISQLTNNGSSISVVPTSSAPEPSGFQAPPVHSSHESHPDAAIFLQKTPTFSSNSPYHPDYSGLATGPSPRYQQNVSFDPSLSTDRLNDPIHRGESVTSRDMIESSSLDIPSDLPMRLVGEEFPDYDLCYQLVDLFFKHVNSWVPILHRKNTIDLLFEHAPLGEEETILLHAIIATSLRFSTDKRLTAEYREHQHKLSKEKVQLYGLEHSSVRSLQALVVLTLDLIGDSNGPPGWNMLALIARSAVQLGLGVESTSPLISPSLPSIYTLRAMTLPEPKDWIEDEGRRRLLWAIYLLDRHATIATAFDFALADKDIDRRLPCRDDYFISNQAIETPSFASGEPSMSNRPTKYLGPFSYYIEVIGILSRIHLFLKRPVDIGALEDVSRWQTDYRALDRELQSWRYSLPPEYRNVSRLLESRSKTPECGMLLLHAAYFTTVIRLHSSAGYPTTRSPIFQPSYSAATSCQTAVENIVELAEFARRAGILDRAGPFFAFSLWVAARVLLVHGSSIDHRVKPCIALLVDGLRLIGAHWPVASRYAALLQRVLDEYHHSATHAPGAGTPGSMRILSDMRRTAFDLDALTSRQPRLHPPLAAPLAVPAPADADAIPQPQAQPQPPTPSRTPAPAHLEYLDVFDFFNYPRLPPVSFEGGPVAGGAVDGAGARAQENGLNGFSVGGFGIDASSDWLSQQLDTF